MAGYKDKECKICSKKYTPLSPSSKVCSKECKDENRRRNERSSSYKKKEKFERSCSACGILYTTTDTRKIYCGALKCEKVRQRRKNKRSEENRPNRSDYKSLYYSNNKEVILKNSYVRNCKAREAEGLPVLPYSPREVFKYTLKQVTSEFKRLGYTLVSSEYVNNRSHLKVICPEGHNWSVAFHNFKNGESKCPKCFPRLFNTSKAEKELTDCFRGSGLEVIENSRKIIPPYELDIYFPEKKVAIEYCGLYWHGETASGKPRNYHRVKMDLCAEKGIRLITVFEDEFVERPDIVKSRIENSLGLIENKIYARKCAVEKIENNTASKFLDENHLQGYVGCKVSFGLFYGGELVQVMTFGAITRKHASDSGRTIELKRLASSGKFNVVGGASRLFKQGRQWAVEEGYTSIKSYCDMRWANSASTVYSKLGFELKAETKYSPHYTKSQKRYRNFSLRKTPEERLTGKTEWELRQAQGFDRIWDCGHRTYVYIL